MSEPAPYSEAEKAWNDLQEQLTTLRGQAFATFRKVVPKLSEQKATRLFFDNDWAASFLAKIEQHFSDHREYIALHVLAISNNLEFHKHPKLDFPGEFSVETYYREIIANPYCLLPQPNPRQNNPPGIEP